MIDWLVKSTPSGPRSSSQAISTSRRQAAVSSGVKFIREVRKRLLVLLEKLHCVLKQSQTVALWLQALARPARMLRGQYMAFGVRHQAQHPATGVAETGDVLLGAVGIYGIGTRVALAIHVAKDHLAGLVQTLQDPRLSGNDIAFPMGDGQLKALVSFQERTFLGLCLQVH